MRLNLELMSRMAPLVGREMIERLFIEVFGHLCLSASFHIWKRSADGDGDVWLDQGS
ncbi:uncharacterized protein LOC143249061 isoform X6 [Tachypleus tridentatus]|uniref:uncharacterized protein LOC143249061 isoform X6 n=1 Tax=Tachypleus tridentatus TaxID=6853 RepID=UPI003FD195B9